MQPADLAIDLVLGELEQLEKLATPAPWTCPLNSPFDGWLLYHGDEWILEAVPQGTAPDQKERSKADALFVTALRNAFRRLVSELRSRGMVGFPELPPIGTVPATFQPTPFGYAADVRHIPQAEIYLMVGWGPNTGGYRPVGTPRLAHQFYAHTVREALEAEPDVIELYVYPLVSRARTFLGSRRGLLAQPGGAE